VARAIGLGGSDVPSRAGSREVTMHELDLAERLAAAAGLELPAAVRALRDAPEVHETIVDVSDMEVALERALVASSSSAKEAAR
jgi:hypothetical protein